MTTDRTSRFWDRIADKYARSPVKDEDAYQTKLRVTREYFTPDTQVLEFGCGTGSTAITHAPHVAHIRAIDFSARMLEIARDRAADKGVDNVTFEQGDIVTLEAPDASYDVILALSVLHLLKDRRAAIAKVHRMLKPGGVFVSSTACLGDSMKIFKYIAPPGRALGLLPILDVMTADELVESLTDAGFAIDHYWQPGKNKAVFIVAKKGG